MNIVKIALLSTIALPGLIARSETATVTVTIDANAGKPISRAFDYEAPANSFTVMRLKFK